MFKSLLEIIQDLIPNKDLPNSVWISRYLILAASGLLLFFFILNGLQNTQLGSRYGLVALERESKLTHVTFTLLVRNARENLRNFLKEHPSAKTIFIITKYNPKNGFFTLNPVRTDKKIIWEFAAPGNLDLSVTNLEFYFKGGLPELSNLESSSCKVAPLSKNVIDTLQKTVRMRQVDSQLVCPIESSDIENATIAYTVVFFNQAELSAKNISEEELVSDIWSINRKISELYTYFNTEYVLPE